MNHSRHFLAINFCFHHRGCVDGCRLFHRFVAFIFVVDFSPPHTFVSHFLLLCHRCALSFHCVVLSCDSDYFGFALCCSDARHRTLNCFVWGTGWLELLLQNMNNGLVVVSLRVHCMNYIMKTNF